MLLDAVSIATMSKSSAPSMSASATSNECVHSLSLLPDTTVIVVAVPSSSLFTVILGLSAAAVATSCRNATLTVTRSPRFA